MSEAIKVEYVSCTDLASELFRREKRYHNKRRHKGGYNFSKYGMGVNQHTRMNREEDSDSGDDHKEDNNFVFTQLRKGKFITNKNTDPMVRGAVLHSFLSRNRDTLCPICNRERHPAVNQHRKPLLTVRGLGGDKSSCVNINDSMHEAISTIKLFTNGMKEAYLYGETFELPLVCYIGEGTICRKNRNAHVQKGQKQMGMKRKRDKETMLDCNEGDSSADEDQEEDRTKTYTCFRGKIDRLFLQHSKSSCEWVLHNNMEYSPTRSVCTCLRPGSILLREGMSHCVEEVKTFSSFNNHFIDRDEECAYGRGELQCSLYLHALQSLAQVVEEEDPVACELLHAWTNGTDVNNLVPVSMLNGFKRLYTCNGQFRFDCNNAGKVRQHERTFWKDLVSTNDNVSFKDILTHILFPVVRYMLPCASEFINRTNKIMTCVCVLGNAIQRRSYTVNSCSDSYIESILHSLI